MAEQEKAEQERSRGRYLAVGGLLAGATAFVAASEIGVTPYMRAVQNGQAGAEASVGQTLALQDAEAEIARLEADLADRDARIGTLNATLDGLETDLAAARADLAAALAAAADPDAADANPAAEGDAIAATDADADDTMAAADADASGAGDAVSELDRLNALLAEKEATLAERDAALAERDAEIARIAARIEAPDTPPAVAAVLAAMLETPQVPPAPAAPAATGAAGADAAALAALNSSDAAPAEPDLQDVSQDVARIDAALAAVKDAPAVNAPPSPPPGASLAQVHFDMASASLTPGGLINLLHAARAAREMGLEKIEVLGFTDTVGPAEFNRQLAAKRAEAVAKALMDAGLPREMIVVAGMGENGAPISTPDNVAEPLNRCVGIFPAMPGTTQTN